MQKNAHFAIKASMIFITISMVGCASVYGLRDKIPGLDRIISSFSSAQVGAVKDDQGKVIEGTQTGFDVEPSLSEPEQASNQIPAAEQTPRLPQEPIISNRTEAAKEVITTPNVPVATQPKLGALSGKISVITNQGNLSAEGIIVSVMRTDGKSLSSAQNNAVHDVDMVNKVYTPGNMVIRKGDVINFVNQDEIQHNVFSTTGENAFDLGTFGGGLQRAVKLNKEGIVKVYCNIHPGMAAYIAIDDKGKSQIIDSEDGSFEFTELPEGEYSLNLWSIRGEQSQNFTIKDKQVETLNLIFDTRQFKAIERRNKFGETYPQKAKKQGDYF
ncbi:cupredoxin domain-containing protein [Glaciecola sp. 1036]|uniref:cupredoxin domain-containing protein n=1 Tax=Alteromonadaceae TaxID=72275 RepID=UPI003CFFF10A